MGQNINRNRINSKRLTVHFKRIVISSTLLMTIFVATVISIHEIFIFRDIARQQQKMHLEEHKEFVRDLITIEVEYIRTQKRFFDERMMHSVRQNVYSAYNLAEKIYADYHTKFSDAALKQLIIDAVSVLETSSVYREVFINDLNGAGVFYPGKPDYRDANLLMHTDMNGNHVIQRELEFLTREEEGYVRYVDDNRLSVSDDLPENKVVFVKKFPQLNWYFGSKTYLEDYYDEFKEEIASKVSADHFRYGGYVFINEMDGDPIVMDGAPYAGDLNLLDGTDPEKMAVFKLELETIANSPNGDFFSYNWNKIGETEKQPKISFVKPVYECNWLVGGGFYLDDIWRDIETQQNELKRNLIHNLLIILLILLVVILVESMIIYRFNANFRADFDNFTRFFKAGKLRYQAVDLDNLYFDEFKEMGAVANEMILERKKIHQQLVLEQEKAQESDRLKTAFLANMSHEIRTPMNAILGFSGLLNEQELSDDDKKTYLQLIHKNGEFLLKLINDIMDISKIESDQLTIIPEDFLLNELLFDIQIQYSDLIKSQTKMQIHFELQNTLPDGYLLQTDKLRLKQVLDNLIGNALKFTPEGTITLRVAKLGSWLHFNVQDTGIGIADEDIENIFKRFTQARTHASETYGGTGLGLAISQKIVHLLGGDIGVKSTQGKGSDFYFYIPG
ncbi:cache domain-containing protein [uncultured Sunxiuqinia sp.]|uniref:cache domain-containing protein n=1 Tax=uncultured Sunxiuqinia sp. TaxID=1573825 RepID=UPI0030DAAFE3